MPRNNVSRRAVPRVCTFYEQKMANARKLLRAAVGIVSQLDLCIS